MDASASRTVFVRTNGTEADAKARGPGLPTLRSSCAVTSRAMTGAIKPSSRGERAISVKTIAQGMPDDLAEPCMGSTLSRERRLLAALFGAEARRGQGWPKATAGGGASAALSATSSAR